MATQQSITEKKNKIISIADENYDIQRSAYLERNSENSCFFYNEEYSPSLEELSNDLSEHFSDSNPAERDENEDENGNKKPLISKQSVSGYIDQMQKECLLFNSYVMKDNLRNFNSYTFEQKKVRLKAIYTKNIIHRMSDDFCQYISQTKYNHFNREPSTQPIIIWNEVLEPAVFSFLVNKSEGASLEAIFSALDCFPRFIVIAFLLKKFIRDSYYIEKILSEKNDETETNYVVHIKMWGDNKAEVKYYLLDMLIYEIYKTFSCPPTPEFFSYLFSNDPGVGGSISNTLMDMEKKSEIFIKHNKYYTYDEPMLNVLKTDNDKICRNICDFLSNKSSAVTFMELRHLLSANNNTSAASHSIFDIGAINNRDINDAIQDLTERKVIIKTGLDKYALASQDNIYSLVKDTDNSPEYPPKFHSDKNPTPDTEENGDAVSEAVRKLNELLEKRIITGINSYYENNKEIPTRENILSSFNELSSFAEVAIKEMIKENKLIEEDNKLYTKNLYEEILNSPVLLIPVIGFVPCGNAEGCIQEKQGEIEFPKSLTGNKHGEYYFLKASGDSMTEAGIDDGDLVLINKKMEATSGDIVVALTENNESTLKTYIKMGTEIYLHPENKKYKDIKPNKITIQGVAIKVLKTLKQ